MNSKTINEILGKVKNIDFHEDFDTIVAIARGGIIPAGLIQQKLPVDIEILWLNFRNENQQPQHDEPVLLKPINFNYMDKRILLVDDRSRTGKTFNKGKELLKGARYIKTLVVNGKADYPLFDEECFTFPWKIV
ncbi:MAG: phosphoribosyltransferase family protein [Ignavibacteriaceae bacterium]|nr:phosphoribosyltransferase family protein [Ignavibacteriaceae bacterium]